jgi:hypothetical protein
MTGGISSVGAFAGRLSRAIRGAASGTAVLASLAAFVISAMLVMGSPFGIARLEAITGGASILDMKYLYTPEEAYAALAALGDAGRAFDLTHVIPLDFLFGLTYTLVSALAISWFLNHWLPADSRWNCANLVPAAWGGADYLENIGIAMMLVNWPAELYTVAAVTGIVSFLKVAFCTASVLVLIGAASGWALSMARGTAGTGGARA